MSERLQNWNNWRYLPIGTKEREAWHELDRLYRKIDSLFSIKQIEEAGDQVVHDLSLPENYFPYLITELQRIKDAK